MWIFNLTSGWWTWLSGGNTVDQKGIYGIQQLASWNSRPGARKSHSMVMDPSRQSFYVFGGSGYDTENEGASVVTCFIICINNNSHQAI